VATKQNRERRKIKGLTVCLLLTYCAHASRSQPGTDNAQLTNFEVRSIVGDVFFRFSVSFNAYFACSTFPR